MKRTTIVALKLMQESLPQKVDKLYERVRISLVSHLPEKNQHELLERAYGNWKEAGVLPCSPDAVQEILATYNLPKSADPVTCEEYRRLENALDYHRRAFCLDMDGLLIENKQPVSNMKETIAEIRKRHAVVVTTAAPEAEATDSLSHTGFGSLPVFGDMGTPKGKNYLPVSQHFGYARPEKRLVAVSHSMEDMPADVNIPFIHLNVSQRDMAEALKAGVSYLDGKTANGFAVKNSEYIEITKS